MVGVDLKSFSSHTFALCFSIVLISSNVGYVFADHGSGGGGGGCSGDCLPPTLGQDSRGKILVDGGISVNGKPFQVDQFEQTLPTQILDVGKPIDLKLKVYENTGAHYLSHVDLMLGVNEETIYGVKTQSNNVQIIWKQTFEGTQTFEIIDPDNLVSDVNVTYDLGNDAAGNKDRLTELTFSFIPLQKFDTEVIKVQTWDYDRNAWANYFYDLILIEGSDITDSEKQGFEIQTKNTSKIPNWFKINAEFWAQNQIDDDTFVMGIKYLIEQNLMNISNLQELKPEPLLHFIDVEKGAQHYLDRYYQDDIYREWFDENYPDLTIEEAVGMPSDPVIPEWIKNNAYLWTDDLITDEDFLSGIEFLIKNGIISF